MLESCAYNDKPRWVGLIKNVTNLSWNWINEPTEAVYTAWNPQEVNEKSQELHCVEVSKNGSWELEQCSQTLDFICEKSEYFYCCIQWHGQYYIYVKFINNDAYSLCFKFL